MRSWLSWFLAMFDEALEWAVDPEPEAEPGT